MTPAFKSISIFFLAISVFNGCATTAPTPSQPLADFRTDATLRQKAIEMANAYFESQKRGESGSKYGTTSEFKNLAEYSYQDEAGIWFRHPVLYYRVKAGNSYGAFSWTDVSVEYSYNESLRTSGDYWLGLGIKDVSEGKKDSGNYQSPLQMLMDGK